MEAIFRWQHFCKTSGSRSSTYWRSNCSV